MTSLEQQLKKLKTPQTEEFRVTDNRASFLYNKKVATTIDCQTHLGIAQKAFANLVKLNPELENFQVLFSSETADFDRAVLHKLQDEELSLDLCKLINNTIVPFFMLNDCHEVLEYLIYKYKIHTFQPNDLLCALLPYHETLLFARALQLFSKFDSNEWAWLEPYRKDKVPVPKERIFAVLSHKSKLPLLSLLGDKLLEINKHAKTFSNIYTSFYTTTMMCLLDMDLDENFLNVLAPYAYKAIKKSQESNLYLSGLVLIAYLAYTQPLDYKYADRLTSRLDKTHAKIKAREPEKAEKLDEYFKKVIDVINLEKNRSALDD